MGLPGVRNIYGMTEMVFGGAVQCEARSGYHMREADLYFEIVDPVRGHSVPDGEIGEIVFTTLTRIGMPLIRYRTGDLSRFIPEPCPCGSSLRRLDKIAGRIASAACLAGSFPPGHFNLG
jgi:phenylacetate-CoA ligase